MDGDRKRRERSGLRALRRDRRGHEVAVPARGVEKYLRQAHHDKPSPVFELPLSGDDSSELNGSKGR